MIKKILLRCLIGAPIGLCITTAITIIVSALIGDGNYYPVGSELIGNFGNELNAVVVQAVFALLFGAVWAGASVIWEIEHWSLLRQTVVHFLASSISAFPIAYYMYWMPHNAVGFSIYFVMFIILYLIIWFCNYSGMKRRVREMDERVKELGHK